MSPNEEAPFPRLPDSVTTDAEPEAGGTTPCGHAGGFLDRFPEATAAAGKSGDSPARHAGAGAMVFRVLLYAGLVVGAVASLALIASFVLQAVLAGSYVGAGGDYFGSGIEAAAARELLGIPLGGFIAVVLLAFVAICVGAYGVGRGRRAVPAD